MRVNGAYKARSIRKTFAGSFGALLCVLGLLSWATSPSLCRGDEKGKDQEAPRSDAKLDNVKKAIAYIDGKLGSGTAFVVKPSILATNNHVLQDEYIENLRIRFISADRLNAEARPVKLLYRDRQRDLALIWVRCDQEPLPLATAQEVHKGQAIAIIGHPSRAGGAFQELYTVTEGPVEGLVMINSLPWYHLKADATHGNSGGPVVDRQTGKVIGILTSGLESANERGRTARPRAVRPERQTVGDTFCIPSSSIAEALAEIQAAGNLETTSKKATARYAAEMVTLQICVARQSSDEAVTALVDYFRAPFVFAKKLDARDRYLASHQRLMTALAPAIRDVRTSPHLSPALKGTIENLLSNHDQMKKLIEKPKAANIAAFKEKYDAIAKKQDQLRKWLFKELAIPDRVTVGPLVEKR